jgi:diacylglycerol kinase
MSNFFRARVRSFRHAFAGWGYALRTQPNTWIHSAFTIAVIVAGVWLRLPSVNFAVLILTISLVWAAELINTAIESAVDLFSPDHHPLAKTSKDAAAGAVLITAIGAILTGLLILGPPLWERIRGWIF